MNSSISKEYKKLLDERNKSIGSEIFRQNKIDEYSITDNIKSINSQKDLILNLNEVSNIMKLYEERIEQNNIHINNTNNNKIETIKIIKNDYKKKTRDLLNKLIF